MLSTAIELFSTFFKVGLFGFGGGFAIIPLMRTAVLQHHWLTPSQFLGAIAIGQVTPGPVAISATFVGFHVAGLLGAVAATVGIFAPSVLLTGLLMAAYDYTRRYPAFQTIQHAVLAAVVGLIAGITWRLGAQAITGLLPAGIAIVVVVAGLRFRVNYGLLVAFGALAGVIALRP